MTDPDKEKNLDMGKLENKLRALFDKNGNKKSTNKVSDLPSKSGKKEDIVQPKIEKIIVPDSENKMIESSPVSSIVPAVSSASVDSLGFNSLSSSNYPGGLESNFEGIDVSKTDDNSSNGQQKIEESYQNAKMLYENSESSAAVDAGVRPMTARRPSVMTSGFSGVQSRSVGMINSHPEIRGSMGENQIYSVQAKETRQHMPWEVGVDESIVKKYSGSP